MYFFFSSEFSKARSCSYVRECLCSQNMYTKIFTGNNPSNTLSFGSGKKKTTLINMHVEVEGRQKEVREVELIKKSTINKL